MKETELSVFKTDSPILNTDRSVFKIGQREGNIGRSVLKNECIVSFTGLSEENTEQASLKEEKREEEISLGTEKSLASWRQ
jgi:hypothetical protein